MVTNDFANIILPQQQQTQSSINRRVDLLCPVLHLLWHHWSQCGALHLRGGHGENEKGWWGSEGQDPRGKMGRSMVLGLERRQRIGTTGLQCLEDCCEGRNRKPLPHICGGCGKW